MFSRLSFRDDSVKPVKTNKEASKEKRKNVQRIQLTEKVVQVSFLKALYVHNIVFSLQKKLNVAKNLKIRRTPESTTLFKSRDLHDTICLSVIYQDFT
jgi:hypothetical protein